MAAALAASIAVLGTLLGATLTFYFQRKSDDRSETRQIARNLREERMKAYATFVEAVSEYRSSQFDRWNRSHREPATDVALEAKLASYRQRSTASLALTNLQFVATDPDLVASAEIAYELSKPIHRAANSADLLERGNKAMAAIKYFIARAAADIQGGVHPVNVSAAKVPSEKNSIHDISMLTRQQMHSEEAHPLTSE